MRAVSVDEYRQLLRDFYDGRMEASEFEARYLRLFKEDSAMKPEAIFDILDRLFGDVDAFSADPTLRGPDGLDAQALRSRVGTALRQLETA